MFEYPDAQKVQSDGVPQPEQEQHEVTNNDQHSVEKVIPPPSPPQSQDIKIEEGANSDSDKDTNGKAAAEEPKSETTVDKSTSTGPKDEAEIQRDRVMEDLFGKDKS